MNLPQKEWDKLQKTHTQEHLDINSAILLKCKELLEGTDWIVIGTNLAINLSKKEQGSEYFLIQTVLEGLILPEQTGTIEYTDPTLMDQLERFIRERCLKS